MRSFADKIERKLTEMNKAGNEIKIDGRDAAAHFAYWHESLALRTFQDGLLEPLKLLIKARNYVTLVEAIRGGFRRRIIFKSFGKKCKKYSII